METIETYYNGYHFRSRLEARWAVFFDAMGLEYEYEPEGFDLGNGVWYLPDFLLHFHDQDIYLEVKPKNYANKVSDINELMNEKIGKFCMVSDKEIVLCMGMPDSMPLLLSKATSQSHIDEYDASIDLQRRFPGNRPKFEVWINRSCFPFNALGADRFQKALHLARSARFEKER